MIIRDPALILDCDGVIVDSETIHVAVELDYLAEIGLRYEHEVYLSRFVGLGMPEFLTALEGDYLSVTGKVFDKDGFHQALNARAWPRIEAELDVLPGVAELAAWFEGPMAVASSSSSPKLRRKLELVGLSDLFAPHVYSADRVGRSKPAPDLFLYAAEQIGAAPEQCIVVEDSVNGVLAGQAAGMTVIGYTGGGHADQGLGARLVAAGAVMSAGHHEDIRLWIKNLQG